MIFTHINSSFHQTVEIFSQLPYKYITKHALLKMIGAWVYMLNKGNEVGAIVMDFPKAFETLDQNLLSKIEAYGFDTNALTLIQSYFSNRHQIMIKIGDKFSKWKKVSTGVPQVSILGPLYFNTFY